MMAKRAGPPAYWSSGGSIVGRGGTQLGDDEALALAAFYLRRARSCRQADDTEGMRFCARRWREVRRAIRRSRAWRRAAGGPEHSRAR